MAAAVDASAGAEAVEDTAEWLKQIRELCEVSMDAEAIRRKLKGRAVPPSLRGVIWQVVMRVRSKPDALSGQELPVAEGETPLKRDCAQLAQRYCEPDAVGDSAMEMEGILGFYARSRGVEYDPTLGWAELLAPFMTVPMSNGDRYNCFYVLMSKYAVKSLAMDSPCFEVFRLLLMYHDPELCNLLDSLKIGPQDFAATWIRSMFAHWCGPDVVLPLWDAYFLAEDQFFVFFLSLVMLINGRDYVMQLAQTPATLAKELESLPSQLGPDDVSDMVELAEHFSMVTPQSFRADYSSTVFGSGARRGSTHPSYDKMFGTLCLSVPVETILRHSEGAIKFFVIDTRPLVQYDAAHLSYAWHLDATLMMEQPAIFAEELARVEDALASSMQHPCFLHTGNADDAGQLGMIVSQFLQKHHKYVSVVKGGFVALERRVASYGAGGSKYLVRQQLPGQLPGSGGGGGGRDGIQASPSGGDEDAGGGWSSRLSGWKSVAKATYRSSAAKLAEKSAAAKQAAKEKSKILAERYAEYKDKSKRDPKAQYRGADRSLRSELEDDDDTEGAGGKGAEADLEGALVQKLCRDGHLVASIAKLDKQPAVEYVFKCSEVDTEGYLYPSQLVLTQTHVIKLRDRSSRDAEVMSRRPLLSIGRITAKKKHPNLITLVFEVPVRPSAGTGTASSTAAGAAAATHPSAGGSSPSGSTGGAGAAGMTGAGSSGGPKPPAEFSIGDAGDDDGDGSVSGGSVEPEADGGVDSGGALDKTRPTPDSGTSTDSARGSPMDRASGGQINTSESPAPSRDFAEYREMFMVPEAPEAKSAFRVLIGALQDRMAAEDGEAASSETPTATAADSPASGASATESPAPAVAEEATAVSDVPS
eukprot:m.8431 g.8431  ORF g.8431 m.8431 type:complete len:872 (-) comp2537_c0_seq1:237-2852(-)